MVAGVEVDGVTLRRDGVPLLVDLHLHVEDGELLTVMGPSGSGKTTLLRVLAGLEPVDEGTVRIGGRDVTDVPSAQRNVAMVSQRGGLQPHLTARDNIAFPLRLARTDQDLVDDRVEASARVLGLGRMLDRLPRELSAGWRQAAETARELGRAPDLFLLDEPLANVDTHRRARLRRELLMVQRGAGITMVYATNDQAEAMSLGDRVAVLVDGCVAQIGAPTDVHEHPATVTVACLIGSPPMNVLSGRVREGRVVVAGGSAPVGSGADGQVLVGVRPGDLGPEPRRNALRLELAVSRVATTGPEVHVHGDVGDVEVTAVLRTPLSVELPTVGDRLDLYAAVERLRFFDGRTGVATGG